MSTDSQQVDRRALLQNALAAVDKLQAKLDAVERAKSEPIAIIGLSCRFPGGANSAEAYWELLRAGRDAVSEVPAGRWPVEEYSGPEFSDTTWYGGFLDQVDQFDPQFFGISPREAETMDPQQRLTLEVSWEALERAGLAPDKLKGSRTGIFMGITTNDYAHLSRQGDPAEMDVYTATGSALNVTPGRVAYTLGLQGPSVAIDTACSSSLVAVHLAVQSLRSGESDLALAGGVNVLLAPEAFICFSKWGMMAPDGRCKTFDARADGFVRGEGCGVIVLKRLSDALAAGDTVLALIRGSAVNQDGRSSGLTVPNGLAQQTVVRQALANARLRPADVSYVEAHGTGTSLGDPIEIEALGAALGEGRPADRPLAIASVKTNIGHLESAAGIAGLIKVVLAMQHRELPAHLHLQERSPSIPWPRFPVVIPTEQTPWEAPEGARIAGVSSFGFSGTNAHVILEEAPPVAVVPPAPAMERPTHILTLSAKSEPALQELATRFADHLAGQPAIPAADVAYTAATSRAHFSQRLAVVAGSTEELAHKLASWSAGERPAGSQSGQAAGSRPRIAFLFTGQGAQYVQMGRRLYDTQPTFRQALERCDALLRPYLAQPLLSVLYPENGDTGLLDQTAYTQPALFALEYALASLWQSWGVQPALVMGHSVGEYAAACLAGVFSLEDGLKLIAERGRLMQALPPGGEMAAVFADEAQVRAAVAPYQDSVAIAAINGPENVVISGAGEAVRSILESLAADGVKAQRLAVSHAFHSPLMEPMLAEFGRIAASINYAAPQIGLISNLSGGLAGPEVASAAYWQQHVRAPVLFAQGMQALGDVDLFLEIGPKPTLLGLGRRCLPEAERSWLPSLRSGRDDWEQMLESLGTLYLHGLGIDWAGFERDYGPRRRLVLPTYPFQRQRSWLKPSQKSAFASTGRHEQAIHPLLGRRLRSPLMKESVFESQFSVKSPAFLDDHRLYGTPLFPGTGYLEMAMAAASQLFGSGPHILEEVVIQEAMVLPEAGERTVQVTIVPPRDGVATFQIFSLEEGADESWKLHGEGKIRVNPPHKAASAIPVEEIQTRCSETVAADTYYQQLAGLGLAYGPSFQGITQIWRLPEGGEALGQVSLPGKFEAEAGAYQLHPALLDACFQLLGSAMLPASDQEATIYVPVGLASYQVYRPGCSQAWSQVTLQLQHGATSGETSTGNIYLFDETGQPIAEVIGLRLRRVSREIIRQVAQKRLDDWLYEVEWQQRELASPAGVERSEPKSWLIFADQQGVADNLVAQLKAQNETCVVVRPGEVYQASETAPWQLDPAKPEDFRRLLADVASRAGQPYGVVHLWSLDTPQELTAASLVEAQAQICGSTLNLVQALAATDQLLPGSLKLWLVTRGSQAVRAEQAPLQVAQAPLWGLGRTIAVEYPELGCRCVDLDPADGTDPGSAIFQEVWHPDSENQVAWRQNNRYSARLARSSRPQATSGAVELAAATPGILDSLSLRPTVRRQPEAGEVEIRVRAIGLNFRDVLNALGMYPDPNIPLGNECTGTVVAAGEDVTGLRVGDEVIALTAGAFRTFVTVPASQVFPKPANLSLVEAATLPTTFLTAHYGLFHLAGLKAGDRVLIHAAAGGVGLAAVQLAQQAGAEIFGTAGSPEKRAFLKSIGVQHVLDSRTLAFADEVMAITQGAGVNVVLNSLADEFISKSLAILADNGYFLELGKRDQWDESQVASLNPTLHYHRYDLAAVMQDDPSFVGTLFRRLLGLFETGALKPLPAKTFSLEEAGEAFQYMARARHIGKVVVTVPAQFSVEAEATYLITGGLGGLGLVVARWLVEQGARHLVLMGRSEPSAQVRQTLAELKELGAEIEVAQADVSQRAQVADVLAQIEETMPPLRGIIHAAGVLDDGLLPQQAWSRFARVMAPKVEGAWNLHTLTQHVPLNFFVLFSAGGAILGSAGQGNYTAANTFLDGMAHYRHQQGLPAVSINWGAWAEVGMAAALDAPSRERWAAQGINFIASDEGARVLEQVLLQGKAQVAVLPMDWAKLGQQLGDSPPPLLQNLIQAARLPQLRALPASAQSSTRAGQSVVSSGADLEEIIAGVWREVLGVDQISLYDNFFNLGGDSLMSVQAVTRLEQITGVKVPVALLGYQTLGQLAATYKNELSSQQPPEQPVSAEPPSPSHDDNHAVSLADPAISEPVNGKQKWAVDMPLLPFYFGASDQSLFGCYHTPPPGIERSCAVVLCYPLGSEYIRSHRAYQQLAGRLARAGFPTLRFDFFGCGDSDGEGEEGQFEQWLKDISTAVAEVQARSGLQQVSLVGLRLGASLAMLAGAAQDNISNVVLWEPIINGKEYLQELATQHQEMVWRFFVPPKNYKVGDRPAELLGFPLSETLVEDLERLDLLTISKKPAQNVLIVENREAAITEPLKLHLNKLQAKVIHQHLPTFNIWVEDADKGLVPQPTLQTIISWISEVSQ